MDSQLRIIYILATMTRPKFFPMPYEIKRVKRAAQLSSPLCTEVNVHRLYLPSAKRYKSDESKKDGICVKFRKHGKFAHVGSENRKVRNKLDYLDIERY